jgi:hypothetical protein
MKTKEQAVAEKGAWGKDEMADDITLYTIASIKGYNYMMEYDSNSGSEVEKTGARFLRQGYMDGFIAGFAYKLTGEE